VRNRIHDFEAGQDRNRKERLLIALDERQLPTGEDEQGDEQDRPAQDVAQDRLWMGPLSGPGPNYR